MVEIINKKRTTKQALSEQSEIQDVRPYLGMSQLGHSCERFLWYSFRWCYQEEISARKLRLFDRGHREEPAIIEAISKIGISVYDCQQEISAVHGHVKGHIDGKAIGVIEAPKTIHLAEFKTMNDKAFKDVVKSGVKVSKPIYYVQSQLYMFALNLDRTFFLAVNKNDDDYYIERLELEPAVSEYHLTRAEDIILAEQIPEKKYKPTWYECKWCAANDICHNKKKVEANCRMCQSCDILPKGQWSCSIYDDLIITSSQQRLGCKNYKVLPYV